MAQSLISSAICQVIPDGLVAGPPSAPWFFPRAVRTSMLSAGAAVQPAVVQPAKTCKKNGDNSLYSRRAHGNFIFFWV